MSNIFEYYLQTAFHDLHITTDSFTLKSVSFVTEVKENTVYEYLPSIMKDVIRQLTEYFDNKRQIFDLKLNPDGTEFQKKVWGLLVQIPYGKTVSYADMANKLGDPKVIRAAASANGKNPIAIIIPCHRVIGKNGDLIGYAGGLNRKKMLLNHENRVANGVLELDFNS